MYTWDPKTVTLKPLPPALLGLNIATFVMGGLASAPPLQNSEFWP